MENKIVTLTSKKFGTVRTITDGNNVLFCASDVAKALGYVNANKAVGAHCLAITKRYTTISGGRNQEINYIPECDVYRLICHSKLPSAMEFERWVFEEAVPKAVRNKVASEPEQLTLDTTEYHYVDKTYNGEPVITLTDFEHFTGINHDTARSCMRTCCIKGKDYEVLTGYNLASFKVENYGFARGVKSIIILRKSAVQRLLDFYKCTANIAMLKTAEKKPVQKQLTQAKRKFSAAEHIIALEILNNLRLDFQEDLNNPTCIYPEVVKKNIKAIDTAIDYVAMPLAAGIC